MRSGQIVTVETFDHKWVKCRLVEVQGKNAIVCSDQEWRASQRAKREPDFLDWP